MTAQEALKSAKQELEWSEANIPNFTERIEFQKMVVEAIEKQIPKKPKKIDEYYENGHWIQEYECPSCGNPYVDDSYCGTCGQALDWGGVKF